MFNHRRLQCYAMGLSLAKQMPALMQRWLAETGYLQDPLRRALSSVLLNILDGKKRFFTFVIPNPNPNPNPHPLSVFVPAHLRFIGGGPGDGRFVEAVYEILGR